MTTSPSVKAQARDDLKRFPKRKLQLESITRYSLYEVMFYRTNLWDHSRQVSWLTEEIEPHAVKVFREAYDPVKAYLIALIHDDAEIITGDVQAGNKSKMSKEELAEVDKQEEKAITKLASQSPEKIGDYYYKDLLLEALNKTSLEAQVVMLADKLDAFGETLHEIYAGNTHFVTNVVNEYGTIPTPYDYYITYLSNLPKKYPALKPLLQQSSWLFQTPISQDFKTICSTGKPHTPITFEKPTKYLHYDEWKNVLLTHSSQQERTHLFLQQESL